MSHCNLDFEKYRDRYESLYPSFSEEELIEVFEARVEYWKIVTESL